MITRHLSSVWPSDLGEYSEVGAFREHEYVPLYSYMSSLEVNSFPTEVTPNLQVTPWRECMMVHHMFMLHRIYVFGVLHLCFAALASSALLRRRYISQTSKTLNLIADAPIL